MKKESVFFNALQKVSREKGRTQYFLFFLLLSFVFWFFTKFSRTYSEVVVFELKLEQMPTGVLPILSQPLTIEATLNASGFQLLYYALIDNRLTLDMTSGNFSGGTASLPLGSQFQSMQEQLLGDTKIINYFPATVEFDYQEQYTKRIALRAPALTYALGFSAVSIRFSPDSIDLIGPKEEVQKISVLMPEFESSNAIKESFTAKVTLPELPPLVSATQKAIEMQVKVDRFSEKHFQLPIRIKNRPAGKVYKFYPEKINVVLLAPLSTLKTMDSTALSIGVNFSSVKGTGETTLPLQLFSFPPEAQNIRWTPKEVEYLIREE